MEEIGQDDWDEELPGDETGRPNIGAADEAITTWVDIKDYAEEKFGSPGAHASQGEHLVFLQLGLEEFPQVDGDRYVHPRPVTPPARRCQRRIC